MYDNNLDCTEHDNWYNINHLLSQSQEGVNPYPYLHRLTPYWLPTGGWDHVTLTKLDIIKTNKKTNHGQEEKKNEQELL